jgi:hypothetical protein
MTGRREYKYLVPMEVLDDLRSELLTYVELDPFLEGRASRHYTVKSVYFDTRRFDFYRMKVDGANPRLKLRIRGYDECPEGSTVFLEIRRKNLDFISKDRAPVKRRDLDVLLTTAEIDRYVLDPHGSGESRDAARRFLYHYRRGGLGPTALVTYDREAFSGRFDTRLRITFDKHLRGRMFPSLDMLHRKVSVRPVMRRHFVLEVKFYQGVPGWVTSLITRFGVRRMALSKYTLCVESHGVGSRISRQIRAGVPSSRASRWRPRLAHRRWPARVKSNV